MELAEDVSNNGTRQKFERSSAHPDPEGDLQILATPDLHQLVIAAKLEEIAAIHCEKTTSHCW